jgi:hypothetical protein
MTEVFVKFPSHRARSYGLQEIESAGLPKPEAYYVSLSSPRSGMKHLGIYKVTPEQLAALEASLSQHVRFTRMRGPFDDLFPCW